jgi:hypothetical protein
LAKDRAKSSPIFFIKLSARKTILIMATALLEVCSTATMKGGIFMFSAFFSVFGVFLGISLIVLLVTLGFVTGAYKLLKGIIRGVAGLFKKD